jgi:hypothetical protein
MAKTITEQMLEAMNEIDDCSHIEGGELSEAEKQAAASSPPQLRVDRQPVGSPDRKEWRLLTEGQQRFVDGIVRGKTQRQAYRDAFPNQTGTDRTVSAAAHTLLKNPRVITALEEAAEESVDYMVEDANALKRWVTKQLIIRVTGSKNDMGAFRGLELLARSAGMFIQTPSPEDVAPSALDIKSQLDKHLTMLEDVAPKRSAKHTPKRKSAPITAAPAATGIDAPVSGGDDQGAQSLPVVNPPIPHVPTV